LGAWGTGLYSSDFALDLRPTIAAIARLPFDAHAILEILRKTEQQAADKPRNEEHTTFWLVIADQFQKKGLECKEVTRKAISLVDSGADEARLQELGMPPAELRKRTAKLAVLRERLESETASVRRKTLKKPQSLVMAIGDVLVYPTAQGASFNPYFRPVEVVGKVTLDREAVESAFGKLRTGEDAAVLDISIGNRTAVVSKNPRKYDRPLQRSMEQKRSLELREFAN
jgi:hypothetical protein